MIKCNVPGCRKVPTDVVGQLNGERVSRCDDHAKWNWLPLTHWGSKDLLAPHIQQLKKSKRDYKIERFKNGNPDWGRKSKTTTDIANVYNRIIEREAERGRIAPETRRKTIAIRNARLCNYTKEIRIWARYAN